MVFYSILFGVILIGRWYSGQIRRLVDLRLAWSGFFFGLACNTCAFMIASYRVITEPGNTYWTMIGYVSLILSLTAFFFAMERTLPYNTRHAFTIVGLLSALVNLVLPRTLYTALALFASLLALFGIALFLRYSLQTTTGEVRKSMRYIVAGFVIGWFGFILRSDFVYYNLGEIPYLIGLILLLFGIFLFGYSITNTVALDEFDWMSKLVTLYVIQRGGLLVFHHEFESSPEIDQVLTAAGMSGVQSLFQEMTSSEGGLNVVSMGDLEILFAHGSVITCVLIAREPYRILLEKVKDFTQKFEFVFEPSIDGYMGTLSEFQPAIEIVESIFKDT